MFKSCCVKATCENWGCRVQGSVFECDLDEARAEAMLEALRPFVTAEDDLRVYKLCAGCLQRSVVVNGRDFATDPDFYQV